MTISDELMLSILSLDAYNRGKGASIGLTGSQIGSATIVANSDTVLPEKEDQGDQETLAQKAGFFAVHYALADGTNVVSYRGTDTGDGELARDITNGWFIGNGGWICFGNRLKLRHFYKRMVRSIGQT